MSMKRKLFFIFLMILIFISIACGGITINIDQPGGETPLPEPNANQEVLPPDEETSPGSVAEEPPSIESNTDKENLPKLSDLEALWDAGTLDLSDIPDIANLLENEWAESTILPAVIPEIPVSILPTNITGIGIAQFFSVDRVISWYDYGGRAVGSSQNLGVTINPLDGSCDKCLYVLPANKSPNDVIDIAIVDWTTILYYFNDGMVSVGNALDAEKYKALQQFSLPPGKYPHDIVGIASTCSMNKSVDEAVFYAWYKDGTVSSGTYIDLDAFRDPYEYALPPGKTIELISSIGIACTDDHVYVWYWDGTVSSGMSNDLGMYREPASFTTPDKSLLPEIPPLGESDIGF